MIKNLNASNLPNQLTCIYLKENLHLWLQKKYYESVDT
jgi:hypothetical protein